MNRFDIYDLIVVNGVQEFDPFCPSLWKNPPPGSIVYYVNNDEQGQPDLVVFRTHGDESLWWLLLMINNVDEPFFSIQKGDAIIVPNIVGAYSQVRSIVSRRIVQSVSTTIQPKPVSDNLVEDQFILE